MRISDLRVEPNGDRVRAVAHVVWEDCARPARDIYFETEAEFADRLRCDPNAFAVAAVVPAMRYGEKRLAVEGALCPHLQQGIDAAVSLLRWWYGPPRSAIQIEPRDGFRASVPPATPRAACFLSGGVDSLAMLRTNRLQLPLDHARSFKEALLVYGVDMARSEETAALRVGLFESARRALQPIAEEAQLTVIPVYTNLKTLEPGFRFWLAEFLGAGLGAIATAFSPRFTDMSIASNGWFGSIVSNGWLDYLPPFGSHPVLDPLYGTAGLHLHHEDMMVTRYEKVRLIGGWPVAMDNLRVCWNYPIPPGQLNCGKCGKCTYTMLELLAAGLLARAPTFACDDLGEAEVSRVEITDDLDVAYFGELIGPLEVVYRRDLSRILRRKIRGYRMRGLGRSLSKPIKRLDRVYLHGRIQRVLRGDRRPP